MKGVCEEFFEKVGMRDKVDYDPNSGKTYLHPGRQANMVYDGKVVGYLGEVHPLVADTYGIGDKAYVAVISLPFSNLQASTIHTHELQNILQ